MLRIGVSIFMHNRHKLVIYEGSYITCVTFRESCLFVSSL